MSRILSIILTLGLLIVPITVFADDDQILEVAIFIDIEGLVIDGDECSIDPRMTLIIFDLEAESPGRWVSESVEQGHPVTLEGGEMDSREGCVYWVELESAVVEEYPLSISILTYDDDWNIDLGSVPHEQLSSGNGTVIFLVDDDAISTGEAEPLESDSPYWMSVADSLKDESTAGSTEQPGQQYISVLLVLLPGVNEGNIVSNTDVPGAACHGIGQYESIREGATGSVTNVRGAQDFEGEITAGTVDQYGHCRLAFAVPLFEADRYLFGIDDDLFVECDRDALWSTESGIAVELRFAPNGRYCQPR